MKYFLQLTLVLFIFTNVSFAKNIQEISVNIVANNADSARLKGFKRAERKAIKNALLQATPKTAIDILTRLTDKQIEKLIENIEILQETTKAKKYQALFNIYINDKILQKLIKEYNRPSKKMNHNSLLVIPVSMGVNGLEIWQKENLWRDIFSKYALEIGRGNLIIPIGDLQDRLTIDDERILAADKKALRKISLKYGTANAVIAQINKAGINRIKVILRKNYDNNAIEKIFYFKKDNFKMKNEELLEKAAKNIAEILANSISEYSIFAEDLDKKIKMISIKTNFLHKKEWMRLRKILENLPNLENMKIDRITPKNADISLYYRGNKYLLKKAILINGYKIIDKKNQWILKNIWQ